MDFIGATGENPLQGLRSDGCRPSGPRQLPSESTPPQLTNSGIRYNPCYYLTQSSVCRKTPPKCGRLKNCWPKKVFQNGRRFIMENTSSKGNKRSDRRRIP